VLTDVLRLFIVLCFVSAVCHFHSHSLAISTWICVFWTLLSTRPESNVYWLQYVRVCQRLCRWLSCYDSSHRCLSAAISILFCLSDSSFDKFSDLLEQTSSYASPLIIAGDLNIHLNVTSDSATVKLLNILDQHSLVQYVIGATHRAGRCLDLQHMVLVAVSTFYT